MEKIGAVYRLVCEEFLQNNNRFTQMGIAKSLGVSLSTVNSAVSKLERISAVIVYTRHFEVISLEKLLLYWATHRDLYRDICYQTYVNLEIREIESSMPAKVAYTAYTAYKYVVGEPPADYSQVYVYANQAGLEGIKRRFPAKSGHYNLIVLSADFIMSRMIEDGTLKHSSVSMPQMFVDLWNIKNWYSKEFTDKLMEKMGV